MRIDNTGRNDIIKPNLGLEIKGSDTVAAGAAGSKVELPGSGASYGVTATMVEKALFSLESELDRIKEDAKTMNFDLIRREMSVLSNTLRDEDMKRFKGEGYSLNDTDVETIVTVMDKIKMELAKGGMDISVFGDDLSMDQLEAMTGNAAQAKQMAASLNDCQDGDITYLVENELEPTIENLYRAQHSGGSKYAAKSQPLPEDANFIKQMEQVIQQAGLPVNDTTLGYGRLLLENEIPLTLENIVYVDKLKQMKLPVKEDVVELSIARAVTDGRTPQEAYLMEGYDAAERAVDAMEVVEHTDDAAIAVLVAEDKAITIENLKQAGQQMEEDDPSGESRKEPVSQTGTFTEPQEIRYITARRRLEEIRLIMTAQANYQMLRKGISIETLELEQLVEELKELENEYYKTLLEQQDIEATPEHIQLFRETTEQTEALKWLPSYVLGTNPLETATVHSLYESGSNLQTALEQANEAYETMMTTPRADMGDSIQKAFRNVDAILEDMDLEPTAANQRAVRILAYNQMEITPESIIRMKAADEKMQNLFRNMKPAVVMELIREGTNPLETDVETLNAKAEEISGRLDPGQEEKFSKYLWKLEQNQGLTAWERESYIGIYRLLHQIEKSDGAVVGAVVNQGGELSLRNLLTATRSGRARGMNVGVDTDFGFVETRNEDGASITRQIEAAYQTDCAKEAFGQLEPEHIQESVENGTWQELTPEQLLWQIKEQQTQQSEAEKELELRYTHRQQELFGENAYAEDVVLKLLNDYSLPMDTYHIMAAGQFINNRNSVFRKLFDSEYLEKEPDLKEAKEALLQKFAEAVKTPEDMAEAQMALAETAEHIMEGMINETEISSRAVQDLKVLRTQIQLSTAMSREENYAVPVMIADEMTNVQLKIVRGKKTRGMVDILFETERLGKVAARFSVSQNRMEGFLVSDKQGTMELMRQQGDILREQLSGEEERNLRLDYAWQEELNLENFSGTWKTLQADRGGEEYEIQTRELYSMAKAFIETVKQAA